MPRTRLEHWRNVFVTIAPIPIVALLLLIVLAIVFWFIEPSTLRGPTGSGMGHYFPNVF